MRLNKKLIEKVSVEVEWLLYKLFKIKRKNLCGRKKNENFLCCQQPLIAKRFYLTDDKKEWHCKVCNRCIVMASYEMSEDLNEVLYDWGRC